MFGIFYGFLNLFGRAGYKVKSEIEKNEFRQRAKDNGDLTYIVPGKGTFLTSNGRQVFETYKGKDRVLADLQSGKIYHNYDTARREQYNKEAREFGRTVRILDNKELSQAKKIPAFGRLRLIKDVETGRLLSEIMINNLHFYINQEGLLVRLTDYEKQEHRLDNMPVDVIINLFNKRQKKESIRYKDINPKDWGMISKKQHDFYFQHCRVVVKPNGEVHKYFNEDRDKYFEDLKNNNRGGGNI